MYATRGANYLHDTLSLPVTAVQDELRDAQAVTQRQVDGLVSSVGELAFSVSQIGQLVLHHENDITEVRNEMKSLISNIDRFIQGRQPNGH